MNAWGWQVGAALIGVSFVIIAVYIAKLLNNLNKTLDKAYRIIDYSERDLQDIIKYSASIVKSAETIIGVITKLFSVTNLFKVLKKK
ncbi:MAG: DUF948 domain-containing protein [Clostridioides sp.]|jgi:uncharacterized protein YoxC|nr:DUF948 domain-containing protein [Clostridioides sp.]